MFIGTGLIIILIHDKPSVCSCINTDFQMLGILHNVRALNILGKRYDTTGFCKHRNAFQTSVHIQRPSATVHHARKHIIPQTVREPYLNLCHIQIFYSWLRDRCHHHLRAKEILIFHQICLCLFRIIVVHRQH